MKTRTTKTAEPHSLVRHWLTEDGRTKCGGSGTSTNSPARVDCPACLSSSDAPTEGETEGRALAPRKSEAPGAVVPEKGAWRARKKSAAGEGEAKPASKVTLVHLPSSLVDLGHGWVGDEKPRCGGAMTRHSCTLLRAFATCPECLAHPLRLEGEEMPDPKVLTPEQAARAAALEHPLNDLTVHFAVDGGTLCRRAGTATLDERRVNCMACHAGIGGQAHRDLKPENALQPNQDTPRDDNGGEAGHGEDRAPPPVAEAPARFPGPDVLQMLPFVTGGFTTIVADPPWLYDDQGSRATGKYPGLPIDEIGHLPIEAIAADRCLLFLWTTVAFRAAAEEVASFWGFRVVSELIWEKVSASGEPRYGIGHYVRLGHEIVIIAERGGAKTHDKSIGSVVRAELPEPGPDGKRHSRKPAVFRALFERLAGEGPRLELFARETAPGWLAWGNEVPEADAWRAFHAPKEEASRG